MKKGKKFRRIVYCVILPAAAAAVILFFLNAVSNLSEGHQKENLIRLEDAIHRAAVACYAAEGIYPPDLDYLIQRYGIQINEERYTVDYVPVAENLMPDITILEK